jgi:putative ABC transport system ATP-binding protein
MEPLVKVENTSVIYNEGQGIKEVRALSNISIEIYPHEYVIFFGPSGCGKSTLLNTVAGLENVSRGRVLVGGKDLSHLTDEEMATYHRHQVGFIFQAYNLIPTLTVGENIALPQMFDGLAIPQWRKNAVVMGERFGIKEQMKKIPSELSGGQQQRVGVARALINNPSILLADEPTGNLDSVNARLVLDIFQDLNLNEKKTVIMVTHSPEYLGEADRIFYLKDGTIIKEVRNEKRTRAIRKKDEIIKEGEGGEESEIQKKGALHSELLERIRRPRPGLESEQVTQFTMGIPRERTVERIEEIVGSHIEGEITGFEMVYALDKPYDEGGAGLNKRSAERMGHIIEHLIANADSIQRLEALPEEKTEPTITYLTRGLEEALELDLEPKKRQRLGELLKDRLTNRMGPIKLRRMLRTAWAVGGGGLAPTTARKLSRYIELVILVAHHDTS